MIFYWWDDHFRLERICASQRIGTNRDGADDSLAVHRCCELRISFVSLRFVNHQGILQRLYLPMGGILLICCDPPGICARFRSMPSIINLADKHFFLWWILWQVDGNYLIKLIIINYHEIVGWWCHILLPSFAWVVKRCIVGLWSLPMFTMGVGSTGPVSCPRNFGGRVSSWPRRMADEQRVVVQLSTVNKDIENLKDSGNNHYQ